MIVVLLLLVLLFGALVLVRGRRLLNLLTVADAAVVLGASLYMMAYSGLPVYLTGDGSLFVDMLSAYEVAISCLVFLFAAVFARGYVESLISDGELSPGNMRMFYVSFNVLMWSVVLAFISNNLALLWIFAELTTVASAMLIVVLNAKDNITAAIKYVFITSTAMLFSFIGLIMLFALSRHDLSAATLNWDVLAAGAASLSPGLFALSFVLIFIGFAAKSGIVPFHAWLPPAHAKAPSDVSVLLSSSVVNVGIYAIIRMYAIGIHTDARGFLSALLIFFGVLTIAVASFSMVVRSNLKKLVAFSSVENMGFMVMGIGLGGPIALFWVLFHTLAHALSKALLFFSAGVIQHQYHSVKIESIYDPLRYQPLATVGLIVGGLAVLGFPSLPLFISKFFILSQLARFSVWLLALVLFALLVAAGGFGFFFIRLMARDKPVKMMRFSPGLSIRVPIVVLMIILLFMGLFIPDSLSRVLGDIVAALRWS